MWGHFQCYPQWKEAIIRVFEFKWTIEDEVQVCATQELWIVYFRPSVNSWECNEMAWTTGWPTLSYATTWKWHWGTIHHQSIQIMPSHIKWDSLIAWGLIAELFCSLKSHHCCLQTHLTKFIMLQSNLFTDRWFATQFASFQYLSCDWEAITLQPWATYWTFEVNSFYLSAWQPT